MHKYLNAGVLDKGVFAKTEDGFPQGSLSRLYDYDPEFQQIFAVFRKNVI